MPDSWKVTLPCTRMEAETVQGDLPALAHLDPPIVVMATEPDPAQPDAWRLDAYLETEPDEQMLGLLKSLAPSAAADPLVERIAEQDWVTLSQEGLEPISAGSFFVYTPQHRDRVPAGAIAIEVDAGRAFGTGHHETTTGCLLALDRLKTSGADFSNLLDLGTGTGLLAFAAMRLWPAAQAAASDIDPVSIEVTEENARINDVTLGDAGGQLELAVAPGLEHPALQARAPYDLIIANILAGPLIELAPSVAGALAPGGRLILAGLLEHQAAAVTDSYCREGLTPSYTLQRGDWSILVMRQGPGAA